MKPPMRCSKTKNNTRLGNVARTVSVKRRQQTFIMAFKFILVRFNGTVNTIRLF